MLTMIIFLLSLGTFALILDNWGINIMLLFLIKLIVTAVIISFWLLSLFLLILYIITCLKDVWKGNTDIEIIN